MDYFINWIGDNICNPNNSVSKLIQLKSGGLEKNPNNGIRYTPLVVVIHINHSIQFNLKNLNRTERNGTERK